MAGVNFPWLGSKKMERLAVALIRIGAPLLALSVIGTVSSGIWLGVLGEWKHIGIGLLAMGISTAPLSLACAPGLAFGVPGMALLEQGRKFKGRILSLLAMLYTSTVVTVWAVAVLYFAIRASNGSNEIPLLVWGLGVAVAPWGSMANSEMESGGNEYSLLSIFFLQIGFIGGIVLTMMGKGFPLAIIAIGGSMVISVIFQGLLVASQEAQAGEEPPHY